MKIQIAALILLCACTGKTNFKADAEKSTLTTSEGQPQSAPPQSDAEGVDVPQNIAGAALYCAERKRASDTEPESQFGCRLNEAGTDGKIENLDRSKIVWKSSISENVQVDSETTNPAWHAIYTVRGPTLEGVRTTVRAMNILVQYSNNSPAPAGLFDQPLKDSLGPISNSGDDAAPIFTQGIDPNDPSIY